MTKHLNDSLYLLTYQTFKNVLEKYHYFIIFSFCSFKDWNFDWINREQQSSNPSKLIFLQRCFFWVVSRQSEFELRGENIEQRLNLCNQYFDLDNNNTGEKGCKHLKGVQPSATVSLSQIDAVITAVEIMLSLLNAYKQFW